MSHPQSKSLRLSGVRGFSIHPDPLNTRVLGDIRSKKSARAAPAPGRARSTVVFEVCRRIRDVVFLLLRRRGGRAGRGAAGPGVAGAARVVSPLQCRSPSRRRRASGVL